MAVAMASATTDQPWLLDLFAGAGGAGEGYRRAGFHVVAVDIDPKPLRHNPHEWYVGDALDVLDTLLAGHEWEGYRLDDFDAIHASPPCQDYSISRHITHPRPTQVYPRLIGPVRERLAQIHVPWVIENVMGAAPELPDAIRLCGTTFGARVWRHRLFASNILLYGAGPCRHRIGDVSVRRKRSEYIGVRGRATYRDAMGRLRWRPKSCPFPTAMVAMGIDWSLTFGELGEAIPPAMTEWIGRQLLAAIDRRREVAR